MRPGPGIPALTATSAVPTGAPSLAFEVSIQPWTIPVALGVAAAIVTAAVMVARAIGDRWASRDVTPAPTIDDQIAAALERRTIRSAGLLADDDGGTSDGRERRPGEASR